MFHGQPYCKSCGHDGPNFMWSYHQYMGLSVLLCNKITNELRTVHIDDRDEFHDHSKTEDELEAVFDAFINNIVTREANENEYSVDVVKFALDENNPTTLKCPKCSELLYWRSTGIS
ncbi:hypothetical protein K239x_29780 [Planctomycetes bacterium K23_9]|uniref:Uncharacterized protein n=2 Tax=Stieleria marina TaxID=1930275 RepID=A0A517NV32_9BACT|nr:hypothetical protein K239x_29780 [Planctomycetes bacterium K23_9]